MKSIFSALFLAVVSITGCKQPAAPTSSGLPATKSTASRGEFHRADDPTFTEAQRELIAVARKRLSTSDHRANDAFHRVRATDEGHEVFVLFVTGYEGETPVFKPCHHAAVHFDGSGQVTKVLRGPECWP